MNRDSSAIAPVEQELEMGEHTHTHTHTPTPTFDDKDDVVDDTKNAFMP